MLTWALAIVLLLSLLLNLLTARHARRMRRRTQSYSQTEIEAMTAREETALALDPDAGGDRAIFRSFTARHEDAPDRDKPWFWFAGAAGGPDQRYMMRAVRKATGFTHSRRSAQKAIEVALHDLICTGHDSTTQDEAA